MDLDLSIFGENLKRFRENLKKSQEKFGEENGLGKAGISNYENGVSFPKQSFLMRLVKVYGADLNKMLTQRGYGDPHLENISDAAADKTKLDDLLFKFKQMEQTVSELKGNQSNKAS